jgi:hypothetical protein
MARSPPKRPLRIGCCIRQEAIDARHSQGQDFDPPWSAVSSHPNPGNASPIRRESPGAHREYSRFRETMAGDRFAMRRHRSAPSLVPFGDRLAQQAQHFREEALKAATSAERESLLRKARQTETAAHVDEWLSSPGLQPPH